MRRFGLLLAGVAVVGLGVGSGLAFGMHAVRGGRANSPAVTVLPTASPTPIPSGGPASPTASSPTVPQGTPAPTPTSNGQPAGAVPPAGGQFGRGVTGQVAQLSGDSLVVTSRQGQVNVKLGTTTLIQKLEAATRDDLKVGAQVTASGRRQGSSAVSSVVVGARGALSLGFGGAGGSFSGAAGGSGSTGGSFGGGGGAGGRGGGAAGGFGAATVGTISQVQGDSLVIDTAQGPVTVTLASDTAIERLATGKRDDLVSGATVVVTGEPGADQSALAAANVIIMPTPAR